MALTASLLLGQKMLVYLHGFIEAGFRKTL